LQYLAGLKQDAHYQVHITLQPGFGCVFLIQGATKNHFCWELLNSHATYLWTFDKRADFLPDALAKLERIIQVIRDHGRERYKQAYRDTAFDDIFVFQQIIHRKSDSQVVDPFPFWRQRLEEKLI
jgi:hypothetical protein